MTKYEVKIGPFHDEFIFFVCCYLLFFFLTELCGYIFSPVSKARLESKNVSGFEDFSLEDQANSPFSSSL